MNEEKNVNNVNEDPVKDILINVGIAAATIGLTAALTYIGFKYIKLNAEHKILGKKIAYAFKETLNAPTAIISTIERPKDFGVGAIDMLVNRNGVVNAIINDVKLDDIGRLGEELLKVDGVTKESPVGIFVGLGKEGMGPVRFGY